jgi:curli biogenesis system outer membrane secretion channel CsgG
LKIRVLLVFFFMIALVSGHSVTAQAGAQQYLNPHFEGLTASHKTVAILPFKVTIDTKRLKDITMEQITKQENDEGTEFQRQIYARFLQKSGDLHYRVDFQDVDRTNALLIKAGYNPDSLAGHTMDEIAKVLGVDALVSGTVSQSQPTSQGMAMAQTLLLGFHGSTQRVDIHIDLHNGVDGGLLWNYDHTDSGGGFTGSMTNAVEAMTKSLFKKVAGNFPYQQKR